METKPDYNPATNPNAISIIKQADGNYIGEMQKDGKVVSARQSTPETVLVLLLTHDGSDKVKQDNA